MIQDEIKTIGTGSFMNCYNLKNITLKDGIIYIGSNAFSNCSSLVKIRIPNSVQHIGSYAFNNCDKLTIIVLNQNNVDYWDDKWNASYSNVA